MGPPCKSQWNQMDQDLLLPKLDHVPSIRHLTLMWVLLLIGSLVFPFQRLLPWLQKKEIILQGSVILQRSVMIWPTKNSSIACTLRSLLQRTFCSEPLRNEQGPRAERQFFCVCTVDRIWLWCCVMLGLWTLFPDNNSAQWFVFVAVFRKNL